MSRTRLRRRSRRRNLDLQTLEYTNRSPRSSACTALRQSQCSSVSCCLRRTPCSFHKLPRRSLCRCCTRCSRSSSSRADRRSGARSDPARAQRRRRRPAVRSWSCYWTAWTRSCTPSRFAGQRCRGYPRSGQKRSHLRCTGRSRALETLESVPQ